jgi:hypothetical protein
VENVRPILVDVDPLDVFAIDITTEVLPFVYYKAFFADLVCPIGKSCPKKAGTNNQIIVLRHIHKIEIKNRLWNHFSK